MIGGAALEIYNLYEGSWSSNCYVLVSRSKNGNAYAAVVDPSASAEKTVEFVNGIGSELQYIILTHGHFDHISSLDSLRALAGIPAYIHGDDAEMLGDGKKNAFSLFFGRDMRMNDAEHLLSDGDVLRLGDEEIRVIHTPGHSKGSVCLLCPDFMITGDTLFASGYGRYDLWGGNVLELVSSLRSLKQYDGDLTVYPGHGESEKLSRALENIYV